MEIKMSDSALKFDSSVKENLKRDRSVRYLSCKTSDKTESMFRIFISLIAYIINFLGSVDRPGSAEQITFGRENLSRRSQERVIQAGHAFIHEEPNTLYLVDYLGQKEGFDREIRAGRGLN